MSQENRGINQGNNPSLDEQKKVEEVRLHTKVEKEIEHVEHVEQIEQVEELKQQVDLSEQKEEPTSNVEDVLKAEVEKLKQELEKHKSHAEQYREMHLRALADLENYRRRARKDKEDALKYAAVPLLEGLLPVLDNFERALDAADQTKDANVLQEGVEMVYRQFLNVLSQAGLTLIEAEGKPFNPHEHNAVMQVETDGVEPGIVVEEIQAGYKYKDRVIRPSMVKVSK